MRLSDVENKNMRDYYIEVLKRLESLGIVTKDMPAEIIYNNVVAAGFMLACKKVGQERS